MKKLKPFGVGSMSYESGYTLPVLIGHLEGLNEEESLSVNINVTPKTKRVEIVENAIDLLYQAIAMGREQE